MLLTTILHLVLFFTLSPLFINCCGGEEDEKKSTKPKDPKAKTKKPERHLEKRPPPRRRPPPRPRASSTKLATPTPDTTGTTGTTGTTMVTSGPVVTTPPQVATPEVPLQPVVMPSAEGLRPMQPSMEFLAPKPAPPPPPPPPPPPAVEPSTENPDEDLCRCRDYTPDTLKDLQYLFDLLDN